MALYVQTTSFIDTNASGYSFTLPQPGELLVLQNVTLGSSVSFGVLSSSNVNNHIENHGTIVGGTSGISGQGSGSLSLFNGATGIIRAATGFSGVDMTSSHTITNYGQIISNGSQSHGIRTAAGGITTNFGTISADRGIMNTSANALQTVITNNHGSIHGLVASYWGLGSSAVERIFNSGTMIGDVYLGSGTGSVFDTSVGQVFGRIYGGVGGDTLIGSALADEIYGNTGSDTLRGNAGDDYISASDGADRLYGGAGANRLFGGAGSDNYFVDSETDFIDDSGPGLPGGADYIFSTVSFASVLGIERIYLLGGTAVFAEGVDGQNDFISGNTANNIIDGKSGNDTIRGGWGNDTLTGGAGLDIFQFLTNPNAALNNDTVTDFNAADDTIHVDNLYMTALGPNGPLAVGAFNTGSVATQADDRIIYDTSTGALYYDRDGLGGLAAVQFATLIGAPVISAADFIVV